MNLFTKQKETHKQTYGYQTGKGVGDRQIRSLGISKYKLLCIKQINNKFQLYSTENSIQYPIINHNAKECKNIYICVYN